MKKTVPAFLRQAGRILNSGQSRSILITGNIHDLFADTHEDETQYVPLISFLLQHWSLPGIILLSYELNGPLRFVRESDNDKVRDAWIRWRTGYDSNELAVQRMLAKGRAAAQLDAVPQTYDDSLRQALNNPTLALELLRQICLCSRTQINGQPLLSENLIILIEGADLLMPDAPIHSLSDIDRRRVAICHDWFSDPGFMNGGDSVVLFAESRSLVHHRIAKLPQLLEVEIPSPDLAMRQHFISWFNRQQPRGAKLRLWATQSTLASLTAGMSLHALTQLLRGSVHERRTLTATDLIEKVESYIQQQLGEEMIEFKKPAHRLKDVVGFTRLKEFLKRDFIPRCNLAGDQALAGAAVCGPIGSGKTFVFEAVATELDLPVLVLKNIRSKWFGETDVLFERLRRVLLALSKVLIFVDEADTQFGGVGDQTHETERRLTGKIQGIMSDPQLRGKVIWLLVTARIHRLSPDLRRPGRVGDLIIPVLDPDENDRKEFLKWMVHPALQRVPNAEELQRLDAETQGYSAAGFSSLRSELKALVTQRKSPLDFQQLVDQVRDTLPPAIQSTRQFQTLQALVNCTRRSLLPDPNVTEDQRELWREQLRQLELRGVE